MGLSISALVLAGVLILTSCRGGNGAEQASVPTFTLLPPVSRTPRFTATPLSTRTPLPTFTHTPSITPIPPTPSDTPTPSPTPPIIGIITSLQRVNVRTGPGTGFAEIVALNPGTGVQVLGRNLDGTWLNVRLDDGTEGWVAASLLRLEPTVTPFPTSTPSPDLTALALGTPLPTAIIGGGTITPTPPRSAVTATPPGTAAESSSAGTGTPTESFLPVISDVNALYETATALAGGAPVITPRPAAAFTPSPTGQSPNVPATTVPGGTATLETGTGPGSVQEGADVFALCDNPAYGVAAPTDLGAGSTIDVYWAWFASDRQYIEQHEEAVSYEIRVNGTLLSNWRQFGLAPRQQGNTWVKYWFVRFGPLTAGQYRVTYRATWSRQVFDGFEYFGPGTSNVIEEGSCTFTVR